MSQRNDVFSKEPSSMVAEVNLGPALWDLVGQQRGGLSVPTAVGIIVVLCVLIILRYLFFGPRKRDRVSWLGSRAGRGLIMLVSVLVFAAISLPTAVTITALFAINVPLAIYLWLRWARG